MLHSACFLSSRMVKAFKQQICTDTCMYYKKIYEWRRCYRRIVGTVDSVVAEESIASLHNTTICDAQLNLLGTALFQILRFDGLLHPLPTGSCFDLLRVG